MSVSQKLQVGHAPRCADSAGSADTVFRKPILACVKAANRLSAALLAAEQDGYPVMMAYEGICCRGMSDGTWHADPSVRESAGRPAPDETVHVSPLGTFASREATMPTPVMHCPDGAAALHGEAIRQAFSDVPCRLLVSWMPGRCLCAAKKVSVAVADLNGSLTMIVGLRPAGASA